MSTRALVTRHGRDVQSVFGLLGRDENGLTAALDFTLARNPELLRRVAHLALPGATGDIALTIETREELGRTDLEARLDSQLAVIEAKRGWVVPGQTQLASYAPRVLAAGGGVLTTLSEASAAWARYSLPEQANGVPVLHIPWSTVRSALDAARTASHGKRRHWLNELHDYLERSIKVREPQDNWTFCVVVSEDRPSDGDSRTFREFVEDGIYFHPFGVDGWPKDAPNFLAFRWGNQVQRIHRVRSWEVVPTLQTRFADVPVTDATDRPFLVYSLGPSLPAAPTPSGQNYRATRVWVLLDQLLVGPT